MQKRILVVEDEKNIREAIVDTLVLNNFLTLEAKDGEEGLETALREHPDLIIADVLMPKIDGMKMIKRIREDEWGKDVPVIVLTNFNATDEQMINNIVLVKPLHYFIKTDWDIHDVVKEVHKVLER